MSALYIESPPVETSFLAVIPSQKSDDIHIAVEELVRDIIANNFRGSSELLMQKINIKSECIKVSSNGISTQIVLSGPSYILDVFK